MPVHSTEATHGAARNRECRWVGCSHEPGVWDCRFGLDAEPR